MPKSSLYLWCTIVCFIFALSSFPYPNNSCLYHMPTFRGQFLCKVKTSWVLTNTQSDNRMVLLWWIVSSCGIHSDRCMYIRSPHKYSTVLLSEEFHVHIQCIIQHSPKNVKLFYSCRNMIPSGSIMYWMLICHIYVVCIVICYRPILSHNLNDN